MKIKRFEASSMSEALRMVKKEFGEEAVILSAKTATKAARLFGVKRSGQVVVTAAIDPAAMPDMVDRQARCGDDRMGARPPLANKGPDSDRIGNILKRYAPITRTGQQKLKPRLFRLMTESPAPKPDPQARTSSRSIVARLKHNGLDETLAEDLAEQMNALVSIPDPDDPDVITALGQIIEAMGWVAPVKPSQIPEERRTVVLIGPGGVGKTAVAAKIASRAVMDGEQRVALLSLDDQRIAGTVELERFCGLLGVPFYTARDADQLADALNGMADTRLVVIDTPGLDPGSVKRRQSLADMIRQLEQPEIHLLLNATAREKEMVKVIRFFEPLGPDRILPTHLDWSEQFGALANRMAEYGLPVTYVGSGAQVPEGLQVVGPHDLAGMLLSGGPAYFAGLTPCSPVTVIQRRADLKDSGEYVANRNSDIFHRRTCKSVKRINDDNALLFKDAADAMGQGFKPCRMCCQSLMASKPIDRLARIRCAGGRN